MPVRVETAAAEPRASRRRRRRLYYVGGSKGGTGKTMTALGLIDYLRRQAGLELIIVESDSSNSDVWHVFMRELEDGTWVPRVEPAATVSTLDLQQHEDWLRLVDLCQNNENATVVINSKGGNADEIERYGPILNDALDDIPHELVTLWVLNLYRDSVTALEQFHETVPKSRLHAMLNQCWGAPEDFALYQKSKIKALIHYGAGDGRPPLGSTHFVPRLAPRILTGVFDDRLALERMAVSPQAATRGEITRWRHAMQRVFDEVTG